jgi:hypothetical protein
MFTMTYQKWLKETNQEHTRENLIEFFLRCDVYGNEATATKRADYYIEKNLVDTL